MANLAQILHKDKFKKEQLMDRTQAYAIVTEYVKNQGLINHMLCVEAAMRFYAQKLGQDVEILGDGRPSARFRLGNSPHPQRTPRSRGANVTLSRRA